MKVNNMNIVITGSNGSLGSFLMDYFSINASCAIGTSRKIKEHKKENNKKALVKMDPLNQSSINKAIRWISLNIGNIHAWLNIIGGFNRGKYVEDGLENWTYMYNTIFLTALTCSQMILPIMKKRVLEK